MHTNKATGTQALIMDKVEKIFEKINNQEVQERLGIGTIQTYEILQVNERPYSHVIRCVLRGTDGEKKVYVKIYKPFRYGKRKDYSEKIVREFNTTLFWYQKFKDIDGVGTIKPLYISPADYTIITEETPGKRFVDMLPRLKYISTPGTRRHMRTVLFNIGRWLQVFQKIGEIKDQRFNPGDLIADVDLRLRRLVDYKRLYFDNDDRHRILSILHKMARGIEQDELRVCLLHQDFSLSNILINQEQVIVLDFDDIQEGSIYFDVSRFFHQLEMLTFQPAFHKRLIKKLQRSFLEGYGTTEITEHALFRMFLVRHSFTQIIKIARFSKYPFTQRVVNRWYVMKHFRLIQTVTSGKALI